MKLVKHLSEPKLALLLARLDELASGNTALGDIEYPYYVRHFAGTAIWRRYEDVLLHDEVIREDGPVGLHELRIACKRLRYTLELFEEQLGTGTKAVLAPLMKVQDHLGRLHDDVVSQEIASELHERYPANRALEVYAAALGDEQEQLVMDFHPQWEELSGIAFRRQLALLIAGL